MTKIEEGLTIIETSDFGGLCEVRWCYRCKKRLSNCMKFYSFSEMAKFLSFGFHMIEKTSFGKRVFSKRRWKIEEGLTIIETSFVWRVM